MKRVFLAALIVSVAGGLTAQDLVDADENGVFSIDEMLAAYPELSEEQFVMIDTDGDEAVSMEEFNAAVDRGILN
jgi:hypothetical protein